LKDIIIRVLVPVLLLKNNILHAASCGNTRMGIVHSQQCSLAHEFLLQGVDQEYPKGLQYLPPSDRVTYHREELNVHIHTVQQTPVTLLAGCLSTELNCSKPCIKLNTRVTEEN